MKFQVYNLWKSNVVRQFILISVDVILGLPDEGGFVSFTFFNFIVEVSWK